MDRHGQFEGRRTAPGRWGHPQARYQNPENVWAGFWRVRAGHLVGASLAVLLMHGPGAPGFPGAMSLPGPVPDDRLLFAIDRKTAGHGNTEIAGRAALPAANVIELTW
jgi:hypothetical protein